jgi:translocation and assembly module TamB
MASDDQTTPAAPRKHRLRIWLVCLLALAVALLAAGGWLLKSESGAQFAFGLVDKLSGGMVQSRDVGGRLSGPLQIKQLNIKLENQTITLDDVLIETQLSTLLAGKVHIPLLQIGKLGIISKIDQSKEPAKLPDSIGLPVKLKIDQIQVNGGSVAWGPVDVVTLGAFAVKLDFDGKRYLLDLDQLAARSSSGNNTYSGKINGHASLSTTKPYPLQASLVSTTEAMLDEQHLGANARIDLDGSLAEIVSSIDAQVNKAIIKGKVVLHPFSDSMLGAADLTATALNLNELGKDLPQTNINLQLHANETGSGTLNINNAAAGTYDAGRIPLTDLSLSFTQKDDAFLLEPLLIKLGSTQRPAGSINGSGKYADGALNITLKTDALDLKKLDQRMRATKLAIRLDVAHTEGRQVITLAATEALKKSKLSLNAHGIVADEALTVDKLELRADASAIDASAHIAFSGKQAFSAKGVIRQFNPRVLGDFAQLPTLNLNGNFAVSGARQPRLESDLSFRIHDSQLAGNPLSGEGEVHLRAQTLDIPKLLVVAGKNRLSANGKLDEKNSRLNFDVQAPALAQLGSEFAGELQVKGEVRGKLQQPRIIADWKGNQIRLPGQTRIGTVAGKADLSLNLNDNAFLLSNVTLNTNATVVQSSGQQFAKLDAQAQFAAQDNAPLSILIHADNLNGHLRADTFDLKVSGSTAQHTLSSSLDEREQKWKLSATGGLKNLARAARWEGSINTLDTSGRLNAKLEAPAPLLISQKQVQLDQFKLTANNASIQVEQFLRTERSISTRGNFKRLKPGEILRSLNQAPIASGDLALGGEWNLVMTDKLDGNLNIRRESGDVAIHGSASTALGLSAMEVNAKANKGQLTVQLLADGKRTGRIEGRLATTIGGDGRFSIAPNAPLAGNLKMNTPTLAWLGPMISPALVMEGNLQADVVLDGSFAKPRLQGPVNADGLRLLFTDTGIDLKQGVLRSSFQNDQLMITQLNFKNDGDLLISGPISLLREQLAVEMKIKATRYKLIDRSDRKLVISGDSVVGWQAGVAKANGQFEVNSGLFDIGVSGTPELSDDVIIVGQSEDAGKKTAIALDVSISLGDGIKLQGRGLDATLVGQVRLQANAGDTLRAQGSLRVSSGTFKAYQRELKIEQGSVLFSGPLNNPALDIRAMRRGQEVEAGVSIRGTALAPRITLVSEPNVTDAEKLSWLVLGRGLSGTGDADRDALQSAATSLLSGTAAAGLQSQIASAFGFDDVSIGKGGTDLQDRIITLGKRISSRLYLSFKQSLDTVGSVLLLRYTLTPRITLEGEAGTSSALSVFYNFAFD